jgi:hypothetical protein
MHLHNIMQSNASKAAGLLAAGGIGVYVMLFMRHAGRRSAHMLASGSTTQHAQHNVHTVRENTSPSVQPPPPSISLMPMAGAQPYMRKKYEVEWRDEWDLEGTEW